jgi:hypothetical protein
LTSRHEHPGKMPLRNLTVDGCAWAACGKSLVSKQTALGTRGSSVNKRAGSTTTRFPTGCAGPWKTLVSIRRRPSHDDGRVKPSSTDNNGEFPTALVSRPRRSATTTGGPFLLSKFRTGGAHRLSDFKQVYFGSYRYPNWTALTPPRTPRNDFSAWAFLIVVNVHF